MYERVCLCNKERWSGKEGRREREGEKEGEGEREKRRWGRRSEFGFADLSIIDDVMVSLEKTIANSSYKMGILYCAEGQVCVCVCVCVCV